MGLDAVLHSTEEDEKTGDGSELIGKSKALWDGSVKESNRLGGRYTTYNVSNSK